MRDQDPRGQRAQQVVVVAVPATRLVADLEAIGQALEDSHHLVDRPYLGAAGDLPRLAEHAERNAFAVDIEPDEEHECLLKLGYVRTSTTVFHVTRLTEACIGRASALAFAREGASVVIGDFDGIGGEKTVEMI